MSKISIHGAVTGAFSSYLHHIMLVVSAGVLVGLVSWASMVGPRFIAQRMGIYQEVPMAENVMTITRDDAGAQGMVTQVVDRVSSKITVYMENTSKGMLFILFVVMLVLWMASLFVHLGFMKLLLQLVDKNKSSLAVLLSVRDIFSSYIGGSLLFGLYALVIMVGSSIIFVPIFVILAKLAQLDGVAGLVLMPLVMIGVWIYLIRYVFFGYCIVDKKVGARDSLHMSAKVTAGQRTHVFLFLLVAVLILGLLGSVIKGVFCFRCSDMSMQGLLYMIGISITATPLMMLMMSKVYRQLGAK